MDQQDLVAVEGDDLAGVVVGDAAEEHVVADADGALRLGGGLGLPVTRGRVLGH